MKFLFSLAMLFSWFINLDAQSSTFAIVSPNGSTKLASSLDSAIIKAGEDDIIYAPGGSFAIGDLSISKKVTIIGVGHYPDSSQATGRTSFDGNIILSLESSGSSFIGFFLTGGVQLWDDGRTIQSILIEKCNIVGITNRVGSGAIYNNFTLMHSVVRDVVNFSGFSQSNINIISNVFQGYLTGVYNANIANNIFLLPGTSAHSLNNMNNCTLNNNIFAGVGANVSSAGTNLTFTNNIFGSAPTGIINTGNNSGNKFNISRSALFLTDAGEGEFSYAANYRLRSNSPGTNAGVDGKDAGLYGGQIPYIDGAIPATPHIAFKEVAPQTGANGTLQVRFRVTTQ